MVPVRLYVAGGFAGRHVGPRSHRASRPELRKTSGSHRAESASANVNTLGDGASALGHGEAFALNMCRP